MFINKFAPAYKEYMLAKEPDTFQEAKIQSLPNKFSMTPQMVANLQEDSKNLKPVINFNPEAIGQKTRYKIGQKRI